MNRLPDFIHAITHFYKGGGSAPKPIPPPVAATAAENLSKTKVLDRQRMARGFSSTILDGYSESIQKPDTMYKTLLGQ